MKNLFVLTTILLTLISCKKEIPGCTDYQADNYSSEATYDDNTCQYSGDVLFYVTQPMNYVDVYFNGQHQVISVYYNVSTPSCGASGCATFHAPTGTYNMTAQEQGIGGNSWAGPILVKKNQCVKFELTP